MFTKIPEKFRFPLLSLPSVALKNVLVQMETMEILEVSLASKKANLAIKNCSIKIKKIIFRSHSITLTNWDYIIKLLRLQLSSTSPQTSKSRIINGSRFFNWKKEYLRITCTSSDMEEDAIVAFHYFFNLFKFSEIGYEVTGSTDKFVNNAMRKLPRNVGYLKIGDFSGDQETEENNRRTEEQIKTILDYCNVKNGLSINSPISRLPEEVYNLSYLYIGYAYKLDVADLLKLNCVYLTIWNHEYTNEDVKILIQHWKQNNTRLENFNINVQRDDFDLSVILEGMNGKPWNRKRRNGEIKYEFGSVDCRKHIDIERDCDGLLASVGFGDRHLEFRVWKNRFP